MTVISCRVILVVYFSFLHMLFSAILGTFVWHQTDLLKPNTTVIVICNGTFEQEHTSLPLQSTCLSLLGSLCSCPQNGLCCTGPPRPCIKEQEPYWLGGIFSERARLLTAFVLSGDLCRPGIRTETTASLWLFKFACCFKSPRNAQLCIGKRKERQLGAPIGCLYGITFTAMVTYALYKMNFQPFISFYYLICIVDSSTTKLQ